MKALDVSQDTAGKAQSLAKLGYQAVGLYLRGDRSSPQMVEDLARAGIKRFSVYEKGEPCSAGYFNSAQANFDASHACVAASRIGMPAGSQIFLAVDYDASNVDVLKSVIPYFRDCQKIIKSHGYLCSVYGSGYVGRVLTQLGYAHSVWLAQSTGWGGYNLIPDPAVRQGAGSVVLGMGVDACEVNDLTVLW